MTSLRTVVLLGFDQPITGTVGTHWTAIDGEPAYQRVILVEDVSAVDPESFGDGVSVWIGRQIDELAEQGDYTEAGVLMTVGQEPAAGHEVEFNAWMDNEHVPGLGAAPGTLSAHRYRSVRGAPEYFAIYHLRDLDVNKTPEWKSVGASALSAAMKPHARKRVRGLYTAG